MRSKLYALGLEVSEEAVAGAFEAAVREVSGKTPREVLPEPGEDPALWGGGEKRTALLLAGWLQG
jgi:hypothetical protein